MVPLVIILICDIGYTSVYIFLVIYGLEASLSTAGCLWTIWAQGESNGLNYGEIINLLLVYLPTYVIPFIMALEVFSRDWVEESEEKKTN
ncbi:putative membrane protein [Wickerhamomyces ciferrii]|uniref:Membrane protein n=1 Tax=Wickerhamomyces ciferrii (strain ATCC 14091 / BCRC 22168 / CBS 111 / JCM 3599 / NBRC 0793 / NRRL Y-1031 F-60-10) TaxID=1206466 RepID=K0KPE9_WICCF|nr:uncharacterized protein BN7_2801 [Wickerhamomyces ciferrii]CCH43254.1 putative membrane protein [Wickerhamomyces ciferrii]